MLTIKNIIEIFSKGKSPKGAEFEETWRSFWHKSERLPLTQVYGLNTALDEKANKADLEGLIGAMLPKGEVANIPNLPTDPNKVKTGYSYIVTNEKDPASGLSYIYVAEIVTDAGGVKKVEWNNTKLTAYPKDVALLSKTTPVNISSTAVDILSNKYDSIIFEPYKITFRGSGFSFIVDGKQYLASGGMGEVKEDFVINIPKNTVTRHHIFIDSSVLGSLNLNWVENPNIFDVVPENNANIEKYFREKILLFSTYDGKPVPSGLLSNTISKILARDNHRIHVSFVNTSDRTDIVKLDSQNGVLIFPKSFVVQDSDTTMFTSELSEEQRVPIRCVNYDTGAFEGSSIGYLFINKETLEIKNFWWSQLDVIPSQIWKMIGSIKRSIPDANKIGEVTHISGLFEWELLGGSYADKAQANTGVVDALSAKYNNIVMASSKITFKAAGFSLYLHGTRYAVIGNEDYEVEVDFDNTRMNLYIDSRKLKKVGTTNWSDTPDLFFTTLVDTDNATAKHYLLVTYYMGRPMPVGLLSGIVLRPFTSNMYSFRHCFYGRSTSNEKIKVIPAEGKMIIPPSIAICDEFAPEIFYTPAEYKEVSLIATDWNDKPAGSSIGILVYNKELKIFKHIWWSKVFNFPKGEKWYILGSIKRNSSSNVVVGNVIFQCSLEFDYVGANSSDVVLRNQDVDTFADAAIFKKYADNIGETKRFSFLHVSDVHEDIVRFNNSLQYFNYKEDIAAMLVTGDIQMGDFRASNEWFIQNLNSTSKPICLTPGNHDVGNSKTISLCGTNEEVYEKFIKPIEDQAGMITNGKNYWHRDFADHKIRVISVYEYDDPNDIDANDASQYRIYRGVRVLSQAQINWLLDTLYSTPADYAVIMLTHQNPSTSMALLNIDADWTSDTGGFNPSNHLDGEVFNEIVDAWMNGTSIDKSYSHTGDAAYLAPIVVNKDFAPRGQGEFIGYFFGHTHRDSSGSFVNFPKQKYVCVTCGTTEAGQSKYDDLPRIEGQRSEDAFNLVSVDRDAGKLYLVRIGANVNRDFERRVCKVIGYRD